MVGASLAGGSLPLALGGPFGCRCHKPCWGREWDSPHQTVADEEVDNLWAFPFPQRCRWSSVCDWRRRGFDGIELNYDLDSELSPKSGTPEFTAIRRMADKIGIAISGLCSFLFWPYPLTAHDPERRAKGLGTRQKDDASGGGFGDRELAGRTGAVHIPWRTDYDPVPNDLCLKRAREAVRELLPGAEKARINLNMENIFFNGFLMTPREMSSSWTPSRANGCMCTSTPATSCSTNSPSIGFRSRKRIRNVHLKEFTKKGTDSSLEAFRPLLDGTTNWAAGAGGVRCHRLSRISDV